MTSLYNQLAGLSLFSGSSGLLTDFYGSIASIETSAVRKAKAAFDTPATLAPWLDTPSPATSDRLAQVRAMRTIVDKQPDTRAGDNIDVQTSFTAYKALDRLQLLAEAAAKTSATVSERAALQKAFQRGLTDLQTYLGTAKSDDVTLAFDTVASNVKSIGFAASDGTRRVVAPPVADARDGTIAGLTGTEVISISLAKYGFTDTLTVDLSTIPQPPTLDGIVEALNNRIASVPITDGAGNPQLDGSGNPIPRWQTRFLVNRSADGGWGLAYNVPASETVAMRQANGGDALTIIASQSTKDLAATGSIRPATSPAISFRALSPPPTRPRRRPRNLHSNRPPNPSCQAASSCPRSIQRSMRRSISAPSRPTPMAIAMSSARRLAISAAICPVVRRISTSPSWTARAKSSGNARSGSTMKSKALRSVSVPMVP